MGLTGNARLHIEAPGHAPLVSTDEYIFKEAILVVVKITFEFTEPIDVFAQPRLN